MTRNYDKAYTDAMAGGDFAAAVAVCDSVIAMHRYGGKGTKANFIRNMYERRRAAALLAFTEASPVAPIGHTCPTCGVGVGSGCISVGSEHTGTPLGRLVHSSRAAVAAGSAK